MLGISRSYATQLVYDPDGRKAKARKDGYRGTCLVCGARTDGSRGPSRVGEYCRKHVNRAVLAWQPEEIIAVFKKFHETFGRSPTTIEAMSTAPTIRRDLLPWRLRQIDEARRLVPLPSPMAVQGAFGSWENAVRAAGLEPAKRGSMHAKGHLRVWVHALRAGRIFTVDDLPSEEARLHRGNRRRALDPMIRDGYVEDLGDGRYRRTKLKDPRLWEPPHAG